MTGQEINSLDDLDLEEKFFIACKRRNITMSDVAWKLNVSVQFVGQVKRKQKRSERVEKYLQKIIKSVGLDI